MKSRDQIERELARCILSAAQFEQDDTGEFHGARRRPERPAAS
jgi:hypothetical protein